MPGFQPLWDGSFMDLPSRGLTLATCERWGYRVGPYQGQTVQIADYRDDTGATVAQKVRFRNKDFRFLGGDGEMLYGKHLWRDAGRRIIVTEGEIDALTVSQVLDHRWPVVSLSAGAPNARKNLAANLQWLLRFERVVLCFDMDEPGRDAVEECAGLFPAGKAQVVGLPLKDPNAMLVAGRVEELVKALWDAKEWRPDGIISLEDAFNALDEEPPQGGLPWCLPPLDDLLYGRRHGELVGLGAPSGGGKTTFVFQQITADLLGGLDVGAFLFESTPAETAEALASIQQEKVWAPDDASRGAGLARAREAFRSEDVGKLHLYDHFGAIDWPIVRDRIRYLNKAHGVRLFYIDHLTAFDIGDVKDLDNIVKELGGLVKELDCWIMFISHLTTADGTPHEEGGRVMARHFRGSRAIMFWAHALLALERDQQDQDSLTDLRILKGRLRAASKKRAVGSVIPLTYDADKGKFYTAERRPDGCPFPTTANEDF